MSKIITEQKTPGSAHLNNTMGVLIAGGCAADYYVRRNLGTLLAGCGFGLNFFAAGYMLTHGYDQYGHDVGFINSMATAVVLAPSQFGKKLLPDNYAWGVVGISTVSLLYNLKKTLDARGLGG